LSTISRWNANISEAAIEGTRKAQMDRLAKARLPIINDLGMRHLPATAAHELLEIVMGRYGRASPLLTSNRLVKHWNKLFGDSAAATAILDRNLHHRHFLKRERRSW
jgi:DNA replication protein DnaC